MKSKYMPLVQLCLAVLFVASVSLVYFNFGSSKIYTTIFIGLSSFIASTFFILQPESVNKYFGTTLGIENETSLPARISKMEMNMVEERQGRLASYLGFYKFENEDFVPNQDVILEALEYSIIEDVLSFGKTSEGLATKDRGDGVFENSSHLRNGIDYPTFKLTEIKDFIPKLAGNRFFMQPMYAWDVMKVMLPSKTQIELIRKDNKRGIRLWKRFFFDVSIEIRKPSITMNASVNSVPIGFGSDVEYSKKIYTTTSHIFLKAKFSRVSSESPETVYNKLWINSLFDQIERRYSDTYNKELHND